MAGSISQEVGTMKTYSLTIQHKSGTWQTNWHKYGSPDEINWDKVEEFVKERGSLAYGYQHGHNSRNLVSARTRTVLWERGSHRG